MCYSSERKNVLVLKNESVEKKSAKKVTVNSPSTIFSSDISHKKPKQEIQKVIRMLIYKHIIMRNLSVLFKQNAVYVTEPKLDYESLATSRKMGCG